MLRRYAKFVYNCGQYQQASSLLVSVRALTTDPDKAFSAMWGKLASEVLVQNSSPDPDPDPDPDPHPDPHPHPAA